MKWCFFISNFPFLPEFFGKLSEEIIRRGDECLIIFSSKIAEYDKKGFFSDKAKFISMPDWLATNYKKSDSNYADLLWKDFFPVLDRGPSFKVNYSNATEIAQQTFQFFDFVFDKERPDVFISEPPTGIFSLAAYGFCKRNNIAYLGLEYFRLNNRIDIYDNKFTCSNYKKTFDEIDIKNISDEEKNFAINFIKDFTSHAQLPPCVDMVKTNFSYMGLLKHLFTRLRKRQSSIFQYFIERRRYREFDLESEMIYKSLLGSIFFAYQKKIRNFYQKQFFVEYSTRDKYFFFPLHYQPESSTNVYAAYYCDQLNTAKNIALSLPFPYKLYVKEHPASVGTRPDEFYKKLKKIPNIVLISPEENIENIIKNSLGIITLTGTVGLEAALLGKPVYVLGDAPYSYHPLCRQVESFKDLENKITKDLDVKQNLDGLEDINIRYIVSYFRNTILGNVTLASEKNDTNDYKLIYNSISKLLAK